MIRFEQPFWFVLILLIPLLIYLQRKSHIGIIYPSISVLPPVKSPRIRLFFLRDLLFYLALLSFIVALAGPYRILGEEKDYTKGYLLQLVVDRSGSMGSFMDKKGETDRLDIVKKVVADFISGDGNQLQGRRNDRVGLISFARYADTMAPLTVSHDIVIQLVGTLKLAGEEEDGTSLGDALALGAARIRSYQQKAGSGSSGAVLILLTDGQNNSGTMTPMEAASLAADQDIRVYTIGFGGGYYKNAFGIIREIPPEYGIDEKTLQDIADLTGGQYYNAGDERSLMEVYKKIDTLEKVEMEQIRSTEKDLYFYSFLITALILLFLGFLFRYILFNVVEDEE
jgi:Ca-activated chloride channel family protein